MALYTYKALNSSGSEISGKIQAEDVNSAALVIRDRGLRVLELKAGKRSGFGGQENFSDWLASQRSVSQSSLIFFFRQMSFMLRSGLAVAQALALAESQVSSPRLNLVIRLMKKDIEAGQSLSNAMEKHPIVFTDMIINLVRAGESTGELDIIMDRMALHLDKKAALKAQTVTAMIYPTVVVLAAIGVGVFMTVKIIPKFAQFLLSQGKALPPSTQALIDLSDFMVAHGLKVLAVIILLIISVVVIYQTQSGRKLIDSLLLRLPVIGKALTTASMSQMSWALSMLLKSGVTVFDALKITSRLMGNRVFSDKLSSSSNLILSGRDMASSLAHRQIPTLITQMIAIGEGTGTLDRVLQELGEYYEKLLETIIKRLSALIEPAMILVIGGMVGFVYYAFFQALFSLASGGPR